MFQLWQIKSVDKSAFRFCAERNIIETASLRAAISKYCLFILEKITKEKYISYYDSYADDLFDRCYQKLPDRERAKDILLETFTRGWTKLVESMYIEADIRGFLYTVADKLVEEQIKNDLPDGSNLCYCLSQKQCSPIMVSKSE